MTARTHDAFVFASLVTLATFFPPASLNLATLVVSIIGADIGALIPDMDGAGNRLWDLLNLVYSGLSRSINSNFQTHRSKLSVEF